MLETDVIVALIGLAGVLATALIGYRTTRTARHEKNQALAEMKFQSAAMDFAGFIEEWGEVIQDVEKLFNETCIDRFLILRAWNGVLDPRWTTAVLQVREKEQEPISYVHYELDNDYVAMLRELSLRNTVFYRVVDMPPCGIKSVYEAEGVTSSLWAHLDSRKLANSNAQAITYATFSTHKGEISHDVQTRCAVIAGRLKGVAGSFYG